MKFVALALLVALSTCSETPRVRPNSPTASPTLFHVEKDFIVIQLVLDGYTGELRCLQRITRDHIGPPDCQTCDGSFTDERCYWVPWEHDPDTPGGLWRMK